MLQRGMQKAALRHEAGGGVSGRVLPEMIHLCEHMLQLVGMLAHMSLRAK